MLFVGGPVELLHNSRRTAFNGTFKRLTGLTKNAETTVRQWNSSLNYSSLAPLLTLRLMHGS